MSITTLLFALIAIPFDAGQQSPAPIMLDFTATWCGPCKQMKPGVEALTRKGFPIKAIDIDKFPQVAEKYKVTGVPAFIVIEPGTGRPLAKTEGFQPTEQLAAFYNQAAEKYLAEHENDATTDNDAVETDEVETDSEAARPDSAEEDVAQAEVEDLPAKKRDPASKPARVNPNPWETVVRIKVHTRGNLIFGSGTIIYSSPKESIVLTCAHIFKMEREPQAPPSRFPRKITLDLFDGNLVGNGPSRVHYANETYEGKAVDYDFNMDVGLIRFSPGRRLPYAHVVPKHWQPAARMGMMTVGCSQGQDASAWSTVILNPKFKGMIPGHGGYEAIECERAPIQGRSGGGLFTSDGYIAGVCDFAEPSHDRGLYANPKSIYALLDRNNLMALYAPVRNPSEGLLADNRPELRDTPQQRRVDLASRARGQSDDHDDSGDLSLPDPELFHIPMPKVAAASRRQNRSATTSRNSWHPIPANDLKTGSAGNADHFDQSDEPAKEAELEERTEEEPQVESSESMKPVVAPGKWRPVWDPSAQPISQRIPAGS